MVPLCSSVRPSRSAAHPHPPWTRSSEFLPPSRPPPSPTRKPSHDPLGQLLVPLRPPTKPLSQRCTARGSHRHRPPMRPLAGHLPDSVNLPNRAWGTTRPPRAHSRWPRPPAWPEFAWSRAGHRPKGYISRLEILLRSKPRSKGMVVNLQKFQGPVRQIDSEIVKCDLLIFVKSI
jgi:hypothetical protein